MRDTKGVLAWEEMPDGCVMVKHYGNGVDQVECTHDPKFRRPALKWSALTPDGVEVEFNRNLSELEVRATIPPEYVLDYGGAMLCRICMGDEFTTSTFNRPVKMLVKLSASARKFAQASLF